MKKYIYKRVLLFLCILCIITVKAQTSESGFPSALYYHLPTNNLPLITLPYFDNQELIAEDTCKYCDEAFGVDAIAEFDFWLKSQKITVSNNFDNVEVYRVKVISPTALALQIIFSHFELKENEDMFLYSLNDTNRILGAYTMHSNKPDLSFISNAIFDREMIIEVNRRPATTESPKGILQVDKFIHYYKDRNEFETSLGCHNNVVCQPWYNNWCNQIRSVVKLRYHKVGDASERWHVGSGVLINNTNNNFDPIVLTANHCVTNVSDLALYNVFFNFQSNTCNPTANGNDLMFLAGVDVIAADNDWGNCPDIAIIRLRQQIPLQYNVFYSGWNRNTWNNLPNDHRGIGIHHPAGDVKKISEGDIFNPWLSSCLGVNWFNGYAEGGSSGSPLFITTREVIGVLSWGSPWDNCADDADFYYSWIKNSWSVLQLTLAPGNTEAITHGGIDPISACQQVINLNGIFFPGNDWQPKNQITIQASQQVNISNVAATIISNSDITHPNLLNNSDYIIRAGNKISIFPGFRINTPEHFTSGTNTTYSTNYTFGIQNRISFQISQCTPFIDECGFNHEPPSTGTSTNNDGNNSKTLSRKKSEKKSFIFKIFPNPTNGSIGLNIISENSINYIKIVNALGKEMYLNSNINNDARVCTVQISDLLPGIYFITLGSNNGQFVFTKFIVN